MISIHSKIHKIFNILIPQKKGIDAQRQNKINEKETIESLKNNIISNISHELRTPITITKSAVELALDETDCSRRSDLLIMALKAQERQNIIIENLLTVSHFCSNDFEILKTPVDLTSLLSEALRFVQGDIQEKSLEIINKVEKDVPIVMASKNKLLLALINLIDNSIKFNKKGGIVEIVLKKQENNIYFSISDQGIGIAKKDLERIFDPLTQLDPTSTRKFSGIGMGLTVAKQIIQAQGGEMWLVSKGDKSGSTFFFTLPIKEIKRIELSP